MSVIEMLQQLVVSRSVVLFSVRAAQAEYPKSTVLQSEREGAFPFQRSHPTREIL
jgi:hypothetical protein